MCGGYSSDEGLESDGEGGGGGSRGGRRCQSPPSDKEFIGRCLVAHQRVSPMLPIAISISTLDLINLSISNLPKKNIPKTLVLETC